MKVVSILRRRYGQITKYFVGLAKKKKDLLCVEVSIRDKWLPVYHHMARIIMQVVWDVKLCCWVRIKHCYFTLKTKGLQYFEIRELLAQRHNLATHKTFCLQNLRSRTLLCVTSVKQPSRKSFRLLITRGCDFGFQFQPRFHVFNIFQLFKVGIHCNAVFGVQKEADFSTV
jgi:hypothetical protein